MKYILSLLLLICTISVRSQQQQNPGYEISMVLKPYKNQLVYLAHYFGNDYPIVDSVMLNDRSEAIFKGQSDLPGGMYMIMYPDKSGSMDLLIDSNQRFSLFIDVSRPDKFQVKYQHTPGNELLNDYEGFYSNLVPEMQAAKQQLVAAANTLDSANAQKKLDSLDNLIMEFREEMIRKNPGTLMATLFVAMREPALPANLKDPKNAIDSEEQRKFLDQHFWDGVNFWDGRLAYTPFFDEKMNKYFDKIIDSHADSVIRRIDLMLGYASNNDIMTHYLMNKLLYGTLYHTFKWQDTVFIHLFENFVLRKNYIWMTQAEYKDFSDRAYFLMGKIKGKPATDIVLPGPGGNRISLFSIPSKYTLLAFWDPTCSHCRETLPKLDSIYHARWKAIGLSIFSVAVESDATKEDWINYITEHHLLEWVNVFNSNSSEQELASAGKKMVLQDYDVWYFPSFYLLDRDKNFMAKKLSYTQVFEMVESILKKQ